MNDTEAAKSKPSVNVQPGILRNCQTISVEGFMYVSLTDVLRNIERDAADKIENECAVMRIQRDAAIHAEQMKSNGAGVNKEAGVARQYEKTEIVRVIGVDAKYRRFMGESDANLALVVVRDMPGTDESRDNTLLPKIKIRPGMKIRVTVVDHSESV